MAPVPPLGRHRAIELVEEGALPLSFGSPHPHVAVLEQDGRFRIRALVVDPKEAEQAAAAARRARSPSWMPEHYYALGRPTGKIYADAASRAELVAIMRTMDWPQDW
jgi:hypothetical protein